MPDENQVEIPQSFIALFVVRGRLRAGATREIVAGRYELCDDTASMLTEHAETMLFNLGCPETEVLTRCHQGLVADASVFSTEEAAWVIGRLAELLNWAQPDLGPAGHGGS
jgi:hypothetical protein